MKLQSIAQPPILLVELPPRPYFGLVSVATEVSLELIPVLDAVVDPRHHCPAILGQLVHNSRPRLPVLVLFLVLFLVLVVLVILVITVGLLVIIHIVRALRLLQPHLDYRNQSLGHQHPLRLAFAADFFAIEVLDVGLEDGGDLLGAAHAQHDLHRHAARLRRQVADQALHRTH